MAGVEIIANVCEYPLDTIVKNTGASPEIVKERLRQHLKGHKLFYIDVEAAEVDDLVAAVKQFKSKIPNPDFSKRYGYNAATGIYGDLINDGVIDPAKVPISALRHATSVISLVLSCNSVVVND